MKVNMYKTRYDKLINYYKNNPTEGFVEKHHIIPKCMGGNDSPNNLVLLPVRAHFIAHYLLHKAYPENKSLAHAFAMMGVNNQHQHRNSRLYEKSKLARSKALSGVSRPDWVKEKLRKPKSNTQNYKKPKSKQHSMNISKALKGKPKTKKAVENSLKSKQEYFEKIKKQTLTKIEYYRNLFIVSGLNRKTFYSQHTEVSSSTLKRYLKGL
jgi:hypothetical protein